MRVCLTLERADFRVFQKQLFLEIIVVINVQLFEHLIEGMRPNVEFVVHFQRGKGFFLPCGNTIDIINHFVDGTGNGSADDEGNEESTEYGKRQ